MVSYMLYQLTRSMYLKLKKSCYCGMEFLTSTTIEKKHTLMFPKGENRIARTTPRIPRTVSCSIPLCRSCMREKSLKSSLTIIKTTANSNHTNFIRCGYLLPGDCVRTDQFECSIKVRLSNTKGREDPQDALWRNSLCRSCFIPYLYIQLSLFGIYRHNSKQGSLRIRSF